MSDENDKAKATLSGMSMDPKPWKEATVEERLERCQAAIKQDTAQRRRFETQVLEKIELLEQHTHNAGDNGKMVIPYEQTRRRYYADEAPRVQVSPGQEYF